MSGMRDYEFYGGDHEVGADASGLDPEFAVDKHDTGLYLSPAELQEWEASVESMHERISSMTPEERVAEHQAYIDERQANIDASGEGFND